MASHRRHFIVSEQVGQSRSPFEHVGSSSAAARDAQKPLHHRCRLTNHRPKAITNQASVAIVIANVALWTLSSELEVTANPIKPTQPKAAPAESMLAASRPRRAPFAPIFRFFSFSWLSMRLAAVGKIAGNARNSPPMAGPK